MVTAEEIRSYLTKICQHYEKWWAVDPLTEIIADRQATFSFNQMVQKEEKGQKKDQPKITLTLFQGIQDYIESEPILLVGSPGVGKSTALLRCLVNFAKAELEKSKPRIPVLVQLKRYKDSFSCLEDRSGMLGLIKDALDPELLLDLEDIKKLLFQEKRLILMLDGLNEISAGAVRTELDAFRKKCERCKISLICTTREGGGNLGIKRRLDVQPLSSQEIERFLRECMPSQAQQVWQLLSRDNRELSRTPFVLWMLYNVFQETGTVSETLGEAFRQFFRSFKKHKENVPVTDERRKDWNLWMEELAFEMLNSPDPNNPGLVSSNERAEKVLSTRFGELYGKSSRIEELLKYHLLEEVSDKEISFHHQLIQEYYAAEKLASRLGDLSNEELNCYLNQLKWTEPLAICMSFVESNTAERIVKLALKIDLCLGARLVGSMKSTLISQEIVVELANKPDTEIKDWFKAELLGITRSDKAVPYLERMIQNNDSAVRWHVVHALRLIQSKSTSNLLIKALEDMDVSVRSMAKEALENISNSPSIFVLRSILKSQNQLSNIQEAALRLLMQPFSDDLFKFLKQIAEDPNQELWLRRRAAFDISTVDQEVSLNLLHNMIKEVFNIPKEVLNIVSIDLREIGSEKSVELLSDILNNYNNPVVQGAAAISLASIGSQRAINSLLEILRSRSELSELHREASELCSSVAYALRNSASEELFKISLDILKKIWEDVNLRCNTLQILCQKGGQEIIEEFNKIIFDRSEDYLLREAAILALRFSDNWIPSIAQKILDSQLSEDVILKHEIIDVLQELDRDESIELLTDVLRSSEDSGLKSHAASALHKYSVREDILSLLKEALKNSYQDVRQRAAEALGKPGNENAVSELLKFLEGGDSSDRQSAICALGSIGSEKAYARLLRVFQDNDEDLSIRNLAIWALTQINVRRTLELLTEHLKHIQDRDLLKEIIITLGKSSEPGAVEPLLQLLNKDDEDSMIQSYTLHALGQVATPDHISTLISLPPMMFDGVIAAISAIQSRCGFYNNEFLQKNQDIQNSESNKFIDNLYNDIENIISNIQRNPEVRQRDNENRLTVEIVTHLRGLGYSAHHDPQVGGHVDILVERNNFTWLGEAKIFGDNNDLWEGFQQLTTRYSNGDINQNHVGLIIYIFKENVKLIMEKWQSYLQDKNLPNYDCKPVKPGSSVFTSSYMHQSSGQIFHVRHMPVILHFDPKDRSGRRRKK
jgi:HEAT repeat protein